MGVLHTEVWGFDILFLADILGHDHAHVHVHGSCRPGNCCIRRHTLQKVVAVADMLVDHTQVEESVQAHKVPPVGHMLPVEEHTLVQLELQRVVCLRRRVQDHAFFDPMPGWRHTFHLPSC